VVGRRGAPPGPLVEPTMITPRMRGHSLNTFFKKHDFKDVQVGGYPIPPEWWSRVYEYPWGDPLRRGEHGRGRHGLRVRQRPFKDALASICKKGVRRRPALGSPAPVPHGNMEFVVADFTRPIEAIPAGSLDRVFCLSVLEELGERIPQALAEFHRCLKPGGLCVLTCDVQYDLDQPTPICGGVDIEYLDQAIELSEFSVKGGLDYDKTGAVSASRITCACCTWCW